MSFTKDLRSNQKEVVHPRNTCTTTAPVGTSVWKVGITVCKVQSQEGPLLALQPTVYKYFHIMKARQYGRSFQISSSLTPLCYSTKESKAHVFILLKNCMHVYNAISVISMTHSLPPGDSAHPVLVTFYCCDKIP